MNEYIHFKWRRENTSVFINIKRKLSKDEISMTALLRPEVFGNGWHNSSQTVKPQPLANVKTDSTTNRWLSQAKPGLPFSRLVSEEAALTFQVTSESLTTGNKEVRCLSLVLVNMKKTFQSWRVTVTMVEGAINWEELRIPGQPRNKIEESRLSRARVTLKWPLKRMPGRVCEMDSWLWIARLKGQNRI